MGLGYLWLCLFYVLIQDFILGMLFKVMYFYLFRIGYFLLVMSLGDDRCCLVVYMNIFCLKEGLECYEFICCILQIYSILQYIFNGLNEVLIKN